MIKLLTSSQPFGFGPSSKLVTIVKLLKKQYQTGIKIDFLGDDSALTYVLKNGACFNNIISYNGEYPNPKDYEIVLSVMNPYLVIWAWLNRKKVIFVDSLFWFYTWDKEKIKEVNKIIEGLKSVNKISEAWSLIKNVDIHHMQYIAHKLATSSWIQGYLDDNSITDEEDECRRNFKKEAVGALVDLSYKKTSVKKNKIIISLGGLISPLNREKEAIRYAHMVIGLMEDFIESLPSSIEVILTCNPDIVSKIKSNINKLSIVALNNQDFLKSLNESIAVFIPVGITTIYECAAYETPVVFLPEQHDGNFRNYQRIINLCGAHEKQYFPEILLNNLIKRNRHSNPDQEIKEIQKIIKQLNANMVGKAASNIKHQLIEIKSQILNKVKREKIAKKQKEIVYKNITVFAQKDLVKLFEKVINNINPPKIHKKFNIGIISSAVHPGNSKLIRLARKIGKLLGQHHLNVLTGASIGYTQIISQEAQKYGSKLIGFSPATNSYLHQLVDDNADINIFDQLYFSNKGFSARSLEFIQSCDSVISLSGRMGTLSEFTIAFEERVPVFIYKGFGGISDFIEEIIKKTNKEDWTEVSYFGDPEKLVKSLVCSLKKTYYK